ncbi:MAG TPA: hypothetical protein VNV66_16550 [Pilimelia sp.]|nr:hypothetical protein [Pilimelia sp.]
MTILLSRRPVAARRCAALLAAGVLAAAVSLAGALPGRSAAAPVGASSVAIVADGPTNGGCGHCPAA